MKMTINVRTVDVIPVIVNIVAKVLLINLVTKRCRRCPARNIPSNKKKKSGKREWKITGTSGKKRGNAIS